MQNCEWKWKNDRRKQNCVRQAAVWFQGAKGFPYDEMNIRHLTVQSKPTTCGNPRGMKSNILNAVGNFEGTHNYAGYFIRLTMADHPVSVLGIYNNNKPNPSIIQNVSFSLVLEIRAGTLQQLCCRVCRHVPVAILYINLQ